MSTDDPADFEEDLAFGKEWEWFVSQNLKEKIPQIQMECVEYDKRPELQRAGIDTIISQDSLTIDVKTQRSKHIDSPNLPIETWSVYEENKKGWYHTADCDMWVWVFENRAGTNVHKTGYFMPNSESLHEWFDENYEDYRDYYKDNGDYNTVVRLVPIEDFPDECLVEFDPRLSTDKNTPQSDIQKWTGATQTEWDRLSEQEQQQVHDDDVLEPSDFK